MRAARELSIALGLSADASFLRDGQFYMAAAAGPLLLWLGQWAFPGWHHGIILTAPVGLSLIVWQPLMEELLFRGYLQGQLLRRFSWRLSGLRLSTANILTTLAFCAFHVAHQPIGIAIAVAIPSLLFGYFRERHRHILSALLLHGFYNAAFLAAGASR